MDTQTGVEEYKGAIIFGLSIIFICVIGFKYQDYRLNECSRVVIGKITKIERTDGFSSRVIEFQYNKNKVITYSMDDTYKGIGERCFLKIVCNWPEHSEVFFKITIPDTLKYQPINGWDKVPYGLK